MEGLEGGQRPWWVEVSKCAPQEAFRYLERGGLPPRLKGRPKRPRFKRKKSLDDNRARLTGSVRVFARHVQLPRIGKVRAKEPTEKRLKLLAEGKARILSATISTEADRLLAHRTETEGAWVRIQEADPGGYAGARPEKAGAGSYRCPGRGL